jgi:hypothetical protein
LTQNDERGGRLDTARVQPFWHPSRMFWLMTWLTVAAVIVPLYLAQGLIDWLSAPLSNAAAYCHKRALPRS